MISDDPQKPQKKSAAGGTQEVDDPTRMDTKDASPCLWSLVAVCWQLWFWLLLGAIALQLSVECYGPIDVYPGGTICDSSVPSPGPRPALAGGQCLDGQFSFTLPAVLANQNNGPLASACSAPCSRPEFSRVIKCPNGLNASAEVDLFFKINSTYKINALYNTENVAGTWENLRQCTTWEAKINPYVDASNLNGAFPPIALMPIVVNEFKDQPAPAVNQSVVQLSGAALVKKMRDDMQYGLSCALIAAGSVQLSATDTFGVPYDGQVRELNATTVCLERNPADGDNLQSCIDARGTMQSPCRVCRRSDEGTMTATGLVLLGLTVIIHTIGSLALMIRSHNPILVAMPVVGITWGCRLKYRPAIGPFTRLWWVCTMLLTVVGAVMVFSGDVEVKDESKVIVIISAISVVSAVLLSLSMSGDHAERSRELSESSDADALEQASVKLTKEKGRPKWRIIVGFLILCQAEFDLLSDVLFFNEIMFTTPTISKDFDTAGATCQAAVDAGYATLCKVEGTEFAMQRGPCSASAVMGSAMVKIASDPNIFTTIFTRICPSCTVGPSPVPGPGGPSPSGTPSPGSGGTCPAPQCDVGAGGTCAPTPSTPCCPTSMPGCPSPSPKLRHGHRTPAQIPSPAPATPEDTSSLGPDFFWDSSSYDTSSSFSSAVAADAAAAAKTNAPPGPASRRLLQTATSVSFPEADLRYANMDQCIASGRINCSVAEQYSGFLTCGERDGSGLTFTTMQECITSYLANRSNDCVQTNSFDAAFCDNKVLINSTLSSCEPKKIEIDALVLLIMRILTCIGLLWALVGVALAVYQHGISSLVGVRVVLGLVSIFKGEMVVVEPGVSAALGEDLPQVFAAALLALATSNLTAIVSLAGSIPGLLKMGWSQRKEHFEKPQKGEEVDDADEQGNNGDDAEQLKQQQQQAYPNSTSEDVLVTQGQGQGDSSTVASPASRTQPVDQNTIELTEAQASAPQAEDDVEDDDADGQ